MITFEEEKYKNESFYDNGTEWSDDDVTVIIPGRFPEKKERKPDPIDDWFLPF